MHESRVEISEGIESVPRAGRSRWARRTTGKGRKERGMSGEGTRPAGIYSVGLKRGERRLNETAVEADVRRNEDLEGSKPSGKEVRPGSHRRSMRDRGRGGAPIERAGKDDSQLLMEREKEGKGSEVSTWSPPRRMATECLTGRRKGEEGAHAIMCQKSAGESPQW
jgi:hypothetical protein